MSYTRAGITGRTRVFALLGDPVDHSLSPYLHNAGFTAHDVDAVYVAIPCADVHVECLMRSLAAAGGGGNVTIPHKVRAAGFLDEPTEAVRATGACNAFWRDDSGRLCGDNTDVIGFRRAAEALSGGTLDGASILILGAGGAASAAAYAASEAGAARVAIHNRTGERADALARRLGGAVEAVARLDDLDQVDLVVNATSVGLRPGDPHILPVDRVPPGVTVLDLVYRTGAETTDWVRALRAAGRLAEDGRRMLAEQAAEAAERWSGMDFRATMLDALKAGGEGR